ncbi:MAG: T9SS type A sorting domain-containing protein, partial [Bacteroidia bacterium]
MKKIYLLGLASVFSLALTAQTTLKVKSPIKKVKSVSVSNAKTGKGKADAAKTIGAGANGVQAITGTLVCNTQYVPGTTMDLDFVLTLTNTDAEYGDMLDVTFPAGFTINSTPNDPLGPNDGAASSDGPEAFVGITGQTITWGNNDNYYGGIVPQYDPNGPGSYPFTVNVTIAGTVSGTQTITFDVSGDQFGANPADLIGGTCLVFEQGATIVDGSVTLGGPQTLTNCGNTMLPIAVRIKNLGNDSIMNFPVAYKIDANAEVEEMVTDTILPGDSLDYLFTQLADFSAEADYVVKMYTKIPGESILANDTLIYNFQNTVPVDLSTTTYTNDFEGTGNEYFALYIGPNDPGTSTTNWALSTTTPQSGSRCLNLQAAGASADAWLMFKCMNITTGDSLRITYWTRTNTGFNGGISLTFAGGQTVADMQAGTVVKPFVANTANNQWRKDSVDYSVTSDQTIYLGVRGTGTATGSGTQVKFDNINITKVGVVGLKDNKVSTELVSVFPNPNAGVFTVKATENNSSVAVYSIIGENVYSSKLVKGNNSVDLSDLAAG